MGVLIPPYGPSNARIMIVGDCPGADEEARGMPFVGAAGMELDKMLHEAGIMRTECFTTYVARERPYGSDPNWFIAHSKKEADTSPSLFRPFKDKMVRQPVIDGAALLLKEIHLVQPNIIITLGNLASWVLTNRWSVLKHRGSMLYAQDPYPKVKVIPTISPTIILRDWASRVLSVQDLRRAGRFRNGESYPTPNWVFTIRPTFNEVIAKLEFLLSRIKEQPSYIDFDLETKAGHIDCAGISWSRTEALCIPFMSEQNKQGYWTADEENEIVFLLYKLLTHPNCYVRLQNGLFDCQYTYRHWHFIPNVKQDTMISHHVMFSGLKKSLDFQASLYCDYYVQWKPDKAVWAEGK